MSGIFLNYIYKCTLTWSLVGVNQIHNISKLKSLLLTPVFTLGSGLSNWVKKMLSPPEDFWIYSWIIMRCTFMYIFVHIEVHCPHVMNSNVAMQNWLYAKACGNNNWAILLDSSLPNTWVEIRLKCLLWHYSLVNAILVAKRVKKWKIFRGSLVKQISNGIWEHVIFNLWAWIQTQLLVTPNLLHLGILEALAE